MKAQPAQFIINVSELFAACSVVSAPRNLFFDMEENSTLRTRYMFWKEVARRHKDQFDADMNSTVKWSYAFNTITGDITIFQLIDAPIPKTSDPEMT